MTRKKNDTSLGQELVRRLGKFVGELEKTDDLTKRFTCRTIKLTLKPEPYKPEMVKQTRELLNASQVIFANFLGVSPKTVRDWEQGLKPPSGAACRLMDEIRHKPDYFLQRLQELSTVTE